MGAPKPFGIYPSQTAAIRDCSQRGMSPAEICSTLGLDQRVVADTLRTEAKRTARPDRPPEEIPPGWRQRGGAFVYVPAATLSRLSIAATMRGMAVDQLAARLVETIARDGLVTAVLGEVDDDD